ncbi:MAG: DUF1611 domain-containing protein [Bacteroidales bacterium]|nr:DUF1611 domain-containing protein [Bacteroidales bacterium]
MDGNAIVYCQGAFNTPNGKTAHGLVRFTKRYHVLSVIDSAYAGSDAGEVLDGKPKGIPVVDSLTSAIKRAEKEGIKPSYFVIGLAPDGGRLNADAREVVKYALEAGLNVDCGLHDFLTEDPVFMELASKKEVTIRDVRKPPHRKDLHFFTGNIEKVDCLKLAVLGTDSALGKRTTAWIIVNGLIEKGYKSEIIGTGQTAWMQGAKYSMILDSVVNDFLSGEIEYAIYSAWKNEHPDVIVIEGQGSLMNPAYPGGYEILAAGRPDYVILQHAPARKEYDGFPGYPIQPVNQQINAIEVISGKKVIAVTLNHENIKREDIPKVCKNLESETGLPVFDVLYHGSKGLLDVIEPLIKQQKTK